jgi:hypothetical protein
VVVGSGEGVLALTCLLSVLTTVGIVSEVCSIASRVLLHVVTELQYRV